MIEAVRDEAATECERQQVKAYGAVPSSLQQSRQARLYGSMENGHILPWAVLRLEEKKFPHLRCWLETR